MKPLCSVIKFPPMKIATKELFEQNNHGKICLSHANRTYGAV